MSTASAANGVTENPNVRNELRETTMKTITTAIAASLFTVSVNATDFYNGLDEGNPDLSTQRVSASDFVGVQPGVGDSINRYHGLDDGNADLFKADTSSRTDSGDAPDIYMGISGNPDLQF